MTRTPARLAVVVKGWPRLSETFIAQDLVALEAAGLTLDILVAAPSHRDQKPPVARPFQRAGALSAGIPAQ